MKSGLPRSTVEFEISNLKFEIHGKARLIAQLSFLEQLRSLTIQVVETREFTIYDLRFTI